MSQNIDDIEWEIRPSQTIATFAPGAVYDNTKDSVMILGTDYWDPGGFEPISDPYLLSQIRGKSKYLSKLKWFASVSSPTDEAYVPVATFPTWGSCSECGMLQRRRGHGIRDEFHCKSDKCKKRSENSRKAPNTVPVRFIVVCERGHVDDFPFYEWAHKGNNTVDKCPKQDAQLYLEDRKSSSSSLDSKFVVCKSCGQEKDLGMALTTTGIEHIARKRCNGKSPWLRDKKYSECDLPAMGMLKGATNIYFSIPWSALTIPPFSDELSQEIIQQWSQLEKLSKNPNIFEEALVALFDIKTMENKNGRYVLPQVVEKFKIHKKARSEKGSSNILDLEFKELSSRFLVNDKEFKTMPVDVPEPFHEEISGITLVEKLRQIVTVTGFTRLKPPDMTDPHIHMSFISSAPPEWLPAVENRGEGVFLSINQEALKRWESQPKIIERMENISHGKDVYTTYGKKMDARYVMLHSFSHLLIHSMSDLAGYSVSGLRERIYSSDSMAGILIFTSSPSSDGSLGGLVEQGKPESMEQIIRRAISRSTLCSSDPLCSFSKPDKNIAKHGAACHACMFLPEPSCEMMNEFLDRSMICHTLEKEVRGFFSNDHY